MSDENIKIVLFDYFGTIIDTNQKMVLKECVSSLAKKYKLAVISSSLTEVIEAQLKKEGILEYFCTILGSDVQMNKIAKIKTVLEKCPTDNKNAVFITDTAEDVKDANACGVRAIGVGWGLQDTATIKQAGSLVTVDKPEDLEEMIDTILQ